MKVVLYGAGGMARELAGWLMENKANDVAYCVDDTDDRPADMMGLRVVPELLADNFLVLIAVADPASREAIVGRLRGRHFKRISEVMRHDLAILSPFAEIGRGCIIGPHATVTGDARLWEWVFLHAGTFVGHGSSIGSYSTLSPGAKVCGDCELGERVFMGTNAVVLPGLRIAADTKISAGAVVRSHIDRPCTVYGDPAAPRQ